ncbi:MYG1 family protein [Alicyclobacillus sp. ALC3]|uniref:MYG1 family protein n=1 Tax=Alicyclobacillus sp. ALC3 TaxID=2796143 RepID=UPI002377DB42|nr:MYG1 family protein [Alicyclobacillus sp. ALC3]WDL95831.1 MYG1 family protein [Alicyclobacillus sp. ALC3]
MTIKLGTHNGSFHCDDVVAFVILALLFDDHTLTRTRDKELLGEQDIVFDVGGGSLDHHFTDKPYRENGIPYAAAGLVWRAYGLKLLHTVAPSLTDDERLKVHLDMDVLFFQGIDAVDNGVNVDTSLPLISLPLIVNGFNPPFDSGENEDAAFYRAADIVKVVFLNYLNRRLEQYRVRDLVQEAFENRQDPRVLVLDKGGPWLEALLALDNKEEVLFVVFPDKHHGYRIQTVKKDPASFDARKNLPASWAGLDADELGQVIGIDDAIFVHPARFIGGALSFESVMKMAKLALEE